MAYAALLSLSQTLEQILVYDQYLHPLETMILLQTTFTEMLNMYQEYSHTNKIHLYESQIIDATYRIEDIIDSTLTSIYLSLYKYKTQSSQILSSEFEIKWGDIFETLYEIEVILSVIANTSEPGDSSQTPMLSTNFVFSTRRYFTRLLFQPLHSLIMNNFLKKSKGTTSTMIGFDDDFLAIKDLMYRTSSNLKIIPIVGMAGIGKSTLARSIYEDSIRRQYFDRCVWVIVSQDYSYKDILLEVLQSISNTDDDSSENSVSELIELIHKELFGRRYLFVLDDVWSEKAWDDLYMIFSENANESCVLLTTRLSNIATYVTSGSSPVHKLHLLNDDDSWVLLKQRVFGSRSVPTALEIIGTKIAKECRGLPLTVVVVAGLLRGTKAERDWEIISQNICSSEPTIALHCSKVLSLSYDRLPIHLKPCFLYLTAFPEDSEINVNRLIRLWIAEGFVKSSGPKCLEEVAEDYLDDLVGRSILQASKRKYNGRIKTVGIHDLFREVGTIKAQEEIFHYHGVQNTMVGKQRRLSIHTRESVNHLLGIENPTTHSLLIFADDQPTDISNFRLLRVLDAVNTTLILDPEQLVHIRYLNFRIRSNQLLESWFKLPNLQSLIIQGSFHESCSFPLFVPFEIWTMPSLRHLILPERSYLEQPEFENETVDETNLLTLSIALSLEINTHTTKMLVNLKKLGLIYSGIDQDDWENSQFRNIVHFEKLEELKVVISIQGVVPDISAIAQVELAFPLTLKKLTLDNIQRSWQDMDVVGSLPNLEVLKLRYMVSIDQEWNPVEDQFPKLKYLELQNVPLRYWGADSYHFPSLEILHLVLMGWKLKEIPSNLGEIDTLKLIQLSSCKPSLVDSALQIQADQRDVGNVDIQVIVLM